MSERKISNKFNIHKEYKRMHIMNPYRNTSSIGSGLVDLYPAKIAYATVRLSDVYNGACLKVRYLESDIEEDIYFDSEGVLDINYIISNSLGGDVSVITIYDQSGNGNNMSFSGFGYANSLKIVSSGSANYVDSKPAMLSPNETSDLYEYYNVISLNQGVNLTEFSIFSKVSYLLNNQSQNDYRLNSLGSRLFTPSSNGSAKNFNPSLDSSIRFDGGSESGSIGFLTGQSITRSSFNNNGLINDYINGLVNIDNESSNLNPVSDDFFILPVRTNNDLIQLGVLYMDEKLIDRENIELIISNLFN